MDWIKTLQHLLQTKKIYDRVNETKRIYEYAKRQRPGKLDPATIDYYADPKFNSQIAELAKYEKELDKASKTKFVPPDSGTLTLFAAWVKAANMKGDGSPDARRAALDYSKGLDAYDKRLKQELQELKRTHLSLSDKMKAAADMTNYARGASQALMTIAKDLPPMFGGTSNNAKALSAGQTASRYAGAMSSVHKRLQKLHGLNSEAIKALEQKIKINAEWMKAAKSKVFGEGKILKKNEKALRPVLH